MKITPTSFAVHRDETSPVFGETTVHVKLEDEGAGEFVVIEGGDGQQVRLDFDEVEYVVKAINMLKEGVEKRTAQAEKDKKATKDFEAALSYLFGSTGQMRNLAPIYRELDPEF